MNLVAGPLAPARQRYDAGLAANPLHEPPVVTFQVLRAVGSLVVLGVVRRPKTHLAIAELGVELRDGGGRCTALWPLSLIHISEPTRPY